MMTSPPARSSPTGPALHDELSEVRDELEVERFDVGARGTGAGRLTDDV
jgi:hypothetical protein